MADYSFNAPAIRDRLVDLISAHLKNCRCSRVVLGISGGKDSSVAAALCARALGPENVYGIMLPDGHQIDIADSRRICESLGIHSRTLNIGSMHQALKEQITAPVEETEINGFVIPVDHESDINVGPRLRMTTLRYVAQAMGAFLCGTGNLSEATVGYCTKDGDTSCDFNPLGALTSVEVVEVGKTIPELPMDLVLKTPTDGLSGMSDEEKLGITYLQIHNYLRLGSSGSAEVDQFIASKEKANMHKRVKPPILNPFLLI